MSNILKPGERLNKDQKLVSDDGRFTLEFNSEGNLTVTIGEDLLWNSGTASMGETAIMQDDGNFVIYDKDKKALWATNTEITEVKYLIMQDDGNLVIYDKDGQPIWAAGSNYRPRRR